MTTIMHSRPIRAHSEVAQTGIPVCIENLDHSRFDERAFWTEIPAWSAVSSEEFISYPFQVKNSLSNASPAATERLLAFVRDLGGEEFSEDVAAGLLRAPMAVQLTPYILSRIDWNDPWRCPIRTQFLPLGSRLQRNHPMVGLDSLAEKEDSKVSGLVHRYFDKVLFLPQTTCPVYCRYCTRSYAIGTDTQTVGKFKIDSTPAAWKLAFEYIRSNPRVEDVVISGGDSYNLHQKFISVIAANLLEIPHLRRVRIATKGLAVNPGRILSDDKWTEAITQFATSGRRRNIQVVIHTHFNCPEEISWITRDAMLRLFESGVIVRNQSVLLRGVNDSIERMGLLIKMLGQMQIQPYYVYQHDLVQGVEDLRTSLATCLEIDHGVRGMTAGFNTPTFVVDAPGGGGKRPASSFDYYDPDTGISVYTAPAVKAGRTFLYFDPLHGLDPNIAKKWHDRQWQERVKSQAVEAAAVMRTTYRRETCHLHS